MAPGKTGHVRGALPLGFGRQAPAGPLAPGLRVVRVQVHGGGLQVQRLGAQRALQADLADGRRLPCGLVLLGVVGTLVVIKQTDALVGMAVVPAGSGDSQLGHVMFVAFSAMAGVLAVIAAIDVPWQRWQYAKKLMMTREEVRQEHKEQEGNPEIKGRIRAQQREMARRRMMAEVPKADVVVTNPTHYAVALKYSESRDAAPVVVAKGADDLAAKIREIAAANNVPLLEAPPLARALYRHVEPGEAIPEKLYTAVAQVLAWVFQLRAGHRAERPTAIDVPADMDIPQHLRSMAGADGSPAQAGGAA
mgnify:CR=1 FL=1